MTDVNPTSMARRTADAARTAREVTELLEVLWERGRDAVSSAPVSSSQLRVLYTLDRESGINLRTLGSTLGSTPSSVSRMCDRLQALGFVERAPSPASRRELELRLTTQGKTYLSELRRKRDEALLTMVSAMPLTQRNALLEGLRGFQTAVEATTPRNQSASAESA